jgi:transposase
MIYGIDIAKATFYAARTHNGKDFETREFNNTDAGFKDLLKWCRNGSRKQTLEFGMEATGRYHEPLAYFLCEQGHTVYVANPILVKRFSQALHLRAKTDKIDAMAICRFFSRDPRPVPAFQPPSEARRRLIGLWRGRDQMAKMRTGERNRLKTPLLDPFVHETHKRVTAELSIQIKNLEREMMEVIKNDPELWEDFQLAISVPGFGLVTCIALLAELDRSILDARKAVQQFGLAPQPRESGSSVRGKARICSASSKRLRPLLFMGARSAIRMPYGPFRAFFDILTERGKHHMVALTAVMRKMLATAIGVLTTRTPFDPEKVNRYRPNWA